MCDEIVAVPSKERACRANEALKHAVEAVRMPRDKIYGFGREGSTHLELLSQMLDSTVFLRAALENEDLLGPIFPSKWFNSFYSPEMESVGGSAKHHQQKNISKTPNPNNDRDTNDKICSCNWHYFQKHLLISSHNLVKHIAQIMQRDGLELSSFPMCYPPFIDCKLNCPNCYNPSWDAADVFEAFAMFDDLLLDALPFVKSVEQNTSSQDSKSYRCLKPGVFLMPERGPQIPFDFNFTSPAVIDETTSSEARLLTAVLSDTDHDYSWVSVEGNRGTGKSCALQEIGQLDVVREKYSGGVLYVQITGQTTFNRIRRIISRFLARRGANEIAHSLDLCLDVSDFVQNAAKWFNNQTSRCLILLDQIGDHATDASIIQAIMENTKNCLVSALKHHDHYKFKHKILFEAFTAGSERSIRLLQKYSNINLSLSNDAQEAFNNALEMCNGLPLGFTNVGRFIRKMATQDCKDYPAESWRRFILASQGAFDEPCSYPTFCFSKTPRHVRIGQSESLLMMGSRQQITDSLPKKIYGFRNIADIINQICQQPIQADAESDPFIIFSTNHHRTLKHLRQTPLNQGLSRYFITLPKLKCRPPLTPSHQDRMKVSIRSICLCENRLILQKRAILTKKPISYFQLDGPGEFQCSEKIFEEQMLSDIEIRRTINQFKKALISSRIAFSDDFLSFENLGSMLLSSCLYPRFSIGSKSNSVMAILLRTTHVTKAFRGIEVYFELMSILFNSGLGFSELGVHDGNGIFFRSTRDSSLLSSFNVIRALHKIDVWQAFCGAYTRWFRQVDYRLFADITDIEFKNFRLRRLIEETISINDNVFGKAGTVFQNGGSLRDILIKICHYHGFKILGEDMDLFYRYLAPENLINLFVPGQYTTQLFISGICVEEPKGVKLPDETDDTISFSFGAENRKVLLNVDDLTPLGLSILMWILMPCEENICPLMKIMQGVKFNNCLRSWMMNTYKLNDSEGCKESTSNGECTGSLESAKTYNIVIPLGWIHTLEVPSQFVMQHGVLGDSAVVVGLPRWIVNKPSIKISQNRNPKPKNVNECMDCTGEALIFDNRYRLVYLPNIKAKFEITALNGKAEAFGFGGGIGVARARTPESTMMTNVYTSGFNTPFISFSQFIRKKMRTRQEGCLMGRMKWLTRVFIDASIIPRGQNTGFIEKAVLKLSDNDDNLSYFKRVKMFENDDCRIHCASLKERMVKQISNEGNDVKILFPSNEKKGENYQATCERVNEMLHSVTKIELQLEEYKGRKEEVEFDLS